MPRLGAFVLLAWSAPAVGWASLRRVDLRSARRAAAEAPPAAVEAPPAAAEAPSVAEAAEGAPSAAVSSALRTLAAATVAMLGGNDGTARTLAGGGPARRGVLRDTFDAFDAEHDGVLDRAEAQKLFEALAAALLQELAHDGATHSAARAQARAALVDGGAPTVSSVADALLAIALGGNPDPAATVSLLELARVFEDVHESTNPSPSVNVQKFPFAARVALVAGALQLLPPALAVNAGDASKSVDAWHREVPGDDHALRRWISPNFERDHLSIVGIGRSADASAYFLPELGIVFDAGFAPKSLAPKCVLLSHGHTDHTAALPALARGPQGPVRVYAPAGISALVATYLHAAACLNFGAPQTLQETADAIGAADVVGVDEGDDYELPEHCYRAPSKNACPVRVRVFSAPHKKGVPACSYGLYRRRKRLKPEFARREREIAQLVRDGVEVTRDVDEGIIFYSGDTTIALLQKHPHILQDYPCVIHECTFLGAPSHSLDDSVQRKGHTHYAQIHPFIVGNPKTTFLLVHWSLRYSKADLEQFFTEHYGGVPHNVVLWI